MARNRTKPEKKKQDTKSWQTRNAARAEKQKLHALLLLQEAPHDHDSPTAALYPPDVKET